MRSAILGVLLVSGCFAEAPDPIDKIVGPMTTTPADVESSSSSVGESTEESSSEESSSSGDAPSPPVCPEWCNNGCDEVLGVYMLCRCVLEMDCHDGTQCEKEPEAGSGHCM